MGTGSGYPLTSQEILKIKSCQYSGIELSRILNRHPETIYRNAKLLGVKLPNENIDYTFDDKSFDNWTPDMAYFLGFIYADGNVDKTRTRFTISTSSKDIDILLKLKAFIKSNHNISNIVVKNKYPQSILRISSPNLCKRLIQLGVIPAKSLCLMWNRDIPNSMINHFVRGYFDGDGSITKRENNGPPLVCILGTTDVLENIRLYFSQVYGKKIGGIGRHNRGNIYNLQIHGWLSVKNFLSWIYKDSTPNSRLDRKYLKALEVLSH